MRAANMGQMYFHTPHPPLLFVFVFSHSLVSGDTFGHITGKLDSPDTHLLTKATNVTT